ncbi:MAG: isoprenylcysteine carboxylmethyltransferase family protein [Candidatus Dormibacteraeota bacterium]|nr:isoprenylcysteine carboxylmethyltransferase family protein [Candidatus Dormibacteraeota bacterium]
MAWAESALVVAAPGASRRIWDTVGLRFVPALMFALFGAAKIVTVWHAVQAILGAETPTVTSVARLSTQVVALIYFGLLAYLCVIRLPRLAGRRGPGTFALAVCSSFAVIAVGLLPDRQSRPQLEVLASAIICVGLLYSIWALLHLRRSFSIMPDARSLVTGGPYALSRHPLYLGEAVGIAGILIPVAGPLAIALGLANLCAQVVRMRWEEQVLAREFPEYAAYARRVPRYAPFLI